MVPQATFNRVSVTLIAIALLIGIGLRVFRLATVPPGLHPDEAVEGYDAYCILKTGRDHRGNFFPLAMESFHDYRMPLFQYSMVPMVAAFGLKPAVVRLCAALWGIADLLAVTAIAFLTLGPPGAAAASLIYAFSPWHLSFSHFGCEMMSASATISLAILSFLLWLRYRKGRWLFVSAFCFGLSLYTYSITKAFTPLMILALAILYQRELRNASRRTLLIAASALSIFVIPQIVIAMRTASDLGGRFAQLSIWSYTCGGCGPPLSVVGKLEDVGASFVSYFSPSFLFIDGDRGDHWTLLHQPGFGQLLPEQSVLVVLALIALASIIVQMARTPASSEDSGNKGRNEVPEELWPPTRKRFAILIIAWLCIAAFPAALTVPLGAWQPEVDKMVPTAEILLNHPLAKAPMRPRLLMEHPDSRHSVLQMAPWTLLCALGFVALLQLGWASPVVRGVCAGLILLGIVFHGSEFAMGYFRDYPIVAAPYFHYGLDQVIRDVSGDAVRGEQVEISDRINEPYIYVLFYEEYPPAKFERLHAWRIGGVSAPVMRFDDYIFVSPQYAYKRLAHGTFVFSAGEKPPQAGDLEIRYPNGKLAYMISRK